MYHAIGHVRCLNLVRLRGDGGVSLQDDGTTVLHLEPLGLPLGLTGRQAVESEGSLRDAVRGVLTALVVLHDAGERYFRMSSLRNGGIQHELFKSEDASCWQVAAGTDASLWFTGYVHRDIRWPNVIRLPGVAAAAASSSSDVYVLIDLEHAGKFVKGLRVRQCI